MTLHPGYMLNNRYRVVSLLAQGGFGAVYLAEDLNLNTKVAIKENLSVSEEAVRQFTFEARLLAKLKHPHLPYVIDYFSLPEQGQYLVMEYIEGQDLQTWLDRGPLKEEQVIPLLEQVCDALTYLHDQNPPVIHRDIKPANIKITPAGIVKLVDFGIAKVYSPSKRTTLGARAVTRGFSPPEQYGRGGTDARSDIYALGATLYALLTGKLPEDGLERQMGDSLTPPRNINPLISPNIEAAILKAMQMEPEMRFQTVAEFKAALQKPYEPPRVIPVIQPTQKVAPAGQSYKPESFVQPAPPSPKVPLTKKPWFAFAIGALVVICLLGGVAAGIGWLLMGEELTPAEPTSIFGGLAKTSTALALQLSSTPSLAYTLTHTITSGPSPSATPTKTISPTAPAKPTDTPTKTLAAKPTWYPCTGSFPSRLHVGERAKVSEDPPLPNRVRSQPNTSSDILGLIEVGEMVEIIGGPACSEGWVWWNVRSLKTGLTGWTAEGDGSDYWLVPVEE